MTTTTTLQELKPSQIKPHKANPRRDVGDLDELAASIAEQGILEPLIVAPNGTGDTYTLIAGHRRLAAAKIAKSKTVLCLVRTDLTDVQSQIEAMLVENLQRTDLTPVEEGEAYQLLLDFPGYTQARIVKATGRSLATVRDRLKLAKLPKGTLEKIHAGQITITEASALVEFAGDKAAYTRLERAAGNPAEFGRNLQDLRNGVKALRARERAHKQLTEAGVRIIDPPGLYDYQARQKLTSLDTDNEVDAHRECPGFAAYIDVNRYSGTAQVRYVCDQPELHNTAPGGNSAGVEDRAAKVAAERATEEQLTADAIARRTWIRDHVFREPSEGLALDMLRAHTVQLVQEFGMGGDFIDFVLGMPTELDHEVDLEAARIAAITELGLLQLAVLLDLLDHEEPEQALLRSWGWSNGYSTPAWRERLSTLYGYTWTEHEQQMLDQLAADPDGAEGDA